jgi:hypothetical protein
MREEAFAGAYLLLPLTLVCKWFPYVYCMYTACKRARPARCLSSVLTPDAEGYSSRVPNQLTF